ncbi:Uncharacterised protein [Bordetella pertussis]|nr:Uncharacterised protein [Bordetella pertussis]
MKAATWRGVSVSGWPSAPCSTSPVAPRPSPARMRCTNWVRGMAQNRCTHCSASSPRYWRKVARSRSRSNSVRSTYSLPYTLWNRPSRRTSRGWFHSASVR